MRILCNFAIASMVISGCTVEKTRIEYPVVSKQIEQKGIKIPGKLPAVHFDPVEPGSTVNDGGFFLTEKDAISLAKIKVEHDQVRDLYVLEQVVHQKEVEILGGAIDEANRRIVILQANLDEERAGTWFSRNAMPLGVVGGFVIGTAVTVGIVAAVAEAK